jgi:hypothetical protein
MDLTPAHVDPDAHLTCLTCGRYQGVEQSSHAIAPGWVQTGGPTGPMMTCECCGGTGWHDTDHGVPPCQGPARIARRAAWAEEFAGLPHAQPRMRANRQALTTYADEADLRCYTALRVVYGRERALTLMADVPPL